MSLKFTLTMEISDINIEGDVDEASNNGSMEKKRKTTAETSIMKKTETSKKNRTVEEKIEIMIKRMQESPSNQGWTEDDESEGDEGEGEEVTVEDLAVEFYIDECLAKHENIPTGRARRHLALEARYKYADLSAEEKAKYVKMYEDREAEKLMKYKAYLRWRVGLPPTTPSGGEKGIQG